MALAVESARPGQSFTPGAIGLSVEVAQLATRNMSAGHKSLVALMRRLGPGVLRVGGNSLDSSWWTSDREGTPAWSTNVINPSHLRTLRRLLVATGWRAILGVDLGHFDPARAANEARTAKHIMGSRLMGIEIGNEPNGYTTPSIDLRDDTYGVDTYLNELSAYGAAIHAASPGISLYGPELSTPSWLAAITSDAPVPFAVLTEHYYPTSYSLARGACKATAMPTAIDLLSPEVRRQESSLLEMLVAAGQTAHRETRISETNTTTSCNTGGGPDTSPVFASALWSLDWALRAASAGVSGLNFHGSFGACTPASFSPICAPSKAAEARGQVAPRPEYYGLLAARQLEGGRFVPVDTVGRGNSEDFSAYATAHAHGVTTLAIDHVAAEGRIDFDVRMPGYTRATGRLLTGPSISSTRGVTFGPSPTGTAIPELGGVFRITLAPASAIVITFRR